MPSTDAAPGQLVEITGHDDGRFTAAYDEWNGQHRDCPPGHKHITRQDALDCAEARLRYRDLGL
jgi:hypothetical protein